MRQRTLSQENYSSLAPTLRPESTPLGDTMNSLAIPGSSHMSMGKPPGRLIVEALMRCAGPDVDAAQLADASVATWYEIDEALTPIIGPRGVGALYARSVHLAGRAYPWLTVTIDVSQPKLDVQALRSALSNQHCVEAANASGTVLQTFHSLLTQLIGAPLTEQLLRSVWTRFLSGDAAQDLPS